MSVPSQLVDTADLQISHCGMQGSPPRPRRLVHSRRLPGESRLVDHRRHLGNERARYAITRGVVTRYVASRQRQGANAYGDGIAELLAEYDHWGGVDGFIKWIGTRNRVSTQPNTTRKGEAVHLAALALHELGVDTAEGFRAAQGTHGQSLETAWRTVPGQRSGISWRYLRMLVGLEDVKPDRMVTAFRPVITRSRRRD